MLFNREHIKDDVELGADSHQLLHFQPICDLRNRGAVDSRWAVSGRADSTQDVHESGLSSPAVSQQSRDLAFVDVKCQT